MSTTKRRKKITSSEIFEYSTVRWLESQLQISFLSNKKSEFIKGDIKSHTNSERQKLTQSLHHTIQNFQLVKISEQKTRLDPTILSSHHRCINWSIELKCSHIYHSKNIPKRVYITTLSIYYTNWREKLLHISESIFLNKIKL